MILVAPSVALISCPYEHRRKYSGYDFSFHCLQPNSEGYIPRDIELDGDGRAPGASMATTRYYAVLIKSAGQSRPKSLPSSRALPTKRSFSGQVEDEESLGAAHFGWQNT